MKFIEQAKNLTVVAGAVAVVWGVGGEFGFRPALLKELSAFAADLQTVASSVDWLRLENYERRLARGGKLTRKECADYRRLADRLKVPPKAC